MLASANSRTLKQKKETALKKASVVKNLAGEN